MIGDYSQVEKNVLNLLMEDDIAKKRDMAKEIFETAKKQGIYPSSIQKLYKARGRGEFGGFAVPAINIRTLTFDLARAIFRVARKYNSGTFVFEIAKSEIGYTNQPPIEYSSMVLGAAITENYSGPVFIQGDHFQVNASKYQENPEKEIEGLKSLIKEAINSGFYNIDIDSSTLVDVTKTDLKEQQRPNYEVCAKLTNYIRKSQPDQMTISVGGEIGEIGQKNSTTGDLEAFMKGLTESLPSGETAISKISVQTGTSHGGVILPDGTLAQVKIDFDTLKTLSIEAREKYRLAGAVQHGASTLPPEAFHKFVECETAEVHLATQFQNIIYESKNFSAELKNKMYNYLKTNLKDEAKPDQTEEQFIYKTRKKALGPFKKEIAQLPKQIRQAIAAEVEAKFESLFQKLNVANTRQLINKYYP